MGLISILYNYISGKAAFLHKGHHGFTDLSRGLAHTDADGFHGFDLFGSASFALADDGAGMAHTTFGGGGQAGNETSDGFVVGVVMFEPFASLKN